MKPLSIVFIALLCVCIILTCLAGAVFNAPANKVDFQEHLYSGDAAAAKGLTFRYEACHGSYYFWDCQYTIGGEKQITSKFHVGGNADYLRDYVYAYDGLILQSDSGRTYDHFHSSVAPWGLSKAWAELLRETNLNNQEYGEKVIRVKNYCEFYPLFPELSLPGGGNSYASIYEGVSSGEITQQFCDYFRIPVLENDHILIGGYNYEIFLGGRVQDGAITYPGSEEHEHFKFSSVSTYTSSAAYFTFIPRTDKGNLVDTSLIPGGYGIYSVQLARGEGENKNIVSDSLQTVCALDPKLTVACLRTSLDEKLLHVYAWDDRQLMLISFDIASGREVQRQNLITSQLDSEPSVCYFAGQNCDLLYVDQSFYVVLSETSDGKVEHCMTLQRDKRQPEEIDLQPSNICFDGQRLAIVYNGQNYDLSENQFNDPYVIHGFEILISVYDSSGVIYSAEFDHTLLDIAGTPHITNGVQVSAKWSDS